MKKSMYYRETVLLGMLLVFFMGVFLFEKLVLPVLLPHETTSSSGKTRTIDVPFAFEGDLTYDAEMDRYNLLYRIQGECFDSEQTVDADLYVIRMSDGSKVAHFTGSRISDEQGSVVFDVMFQIDGSEFDKGEDTFMVSGLVGGVPWNLSAIKKWYDENGKGHVWLPYGGSGGTGLLSSEENTLGEGGVVIYGGNSETTGR